VGSALQSLSDRVLVQVIPVLCFVDGEWGFLMGPYNIQGTHVTSPRRLIKYVTRNGPLSATERAAIAHHLAERLPEA
jgi:hypothetical protein